MPIASGVPKPATYGRAVAADRLQARAEHGDEQLDRRARRRRRTRRASRQRPGLWPTGEALARRRRRRRTRRAPSPRRRRRRPARRRRTRRAAAGTARPARSGGRPARARCRRGSCSAITPIAPAIAPIAAMKKMTATVITVGHHSPSARSGVALDRLGEQHLLGEDQVRAVVVRQLEVVAHRDRVERAGDLAVAAEDAAADVDLIDRGVALAGGDAVLGRVLGGDDADAVGRAGGRAQRAADALLKARVLEAVELVAAAEARVDRRPSARGTGSCGRPRRRARTSSSGRAASRRRRGRCRRRRPARARAGPRSGPRRSA